jgi:hypothetical protein
LGDLRRFFSEVRKPDGYREDAALLPSFIISAMYLQMFLRTELCTEITVGI